MTENNEPQYVGKYFATGTPPEKKKKQAWWKNPAVLLGVGALLIGLGIGSSTAKPETVEVTKEVEVPGPERIKTVTKEVPTTPAACLTALTLAEQAFDYAAEALTYSNEATQAAARLNAAGITAASGKIDGVTAKLKGIAPELNAAKAECRSK